MTDARIAGAAIVIGGLAVLVGGISGFLAMTTPAVIVVAVSLLILGVGVALAQRWAIVASRVGLWVVSSVRRS